MAVVIHGIRNCDTMKKARAWLAAAGIAHAFHDYRVDGIDRTRLQAWVASLGWEALLNRAGTTFRKLPEAARQDLDAARAIDLMLAEPAMIRRPVLDLDGRLILGFSPDRYAEAFARPGEPHASRT